MTLINFEWNATLTSPRLMKLHLDFDKPMMVSSSGSDKDILRVEFLNNATDFVSKLTGLPLNESSWVLKSKIMA